MSRIYFHSKNSTAEVLGSERALLSMYCSSSLMFSLGELRSFKANESPWILKHIPQDCYLHELDPISVNSIETWLRVCHDENAKLILDDKEVNLFDLQLNSAVALGGDALKLSAKIHGQCELHCYVEGPNRNWLADMIDEAMTKSIFRKDCGWESVCELLRSTNDGPVVCSYSVCDSFPNRHVAEWEPEAGDEDGDGWYDLPIEKQWDLALAGLRNKNNDVELMPERWGDFYFGSHKLSGFDFRNKK